MKGAILRSAGIEAPIILFSFPLEREIPDLVKYNLSPFVGSSSYLKSPQPGSRQSEQGTVGIHLKIDTGMGRIGCPAGRSSGALPAGTGVRMPDSGGASVLISLSSDSPDEEDIAFTKQQIRIFQGGCRNCSGGRNRSRYCPRCQFGGDYSLARSPLRYGETGYLSLRLLPRFPDGEKGCFQTRNGDGFGCLPF